MKRRQKKKQRLPYCCTESSSAIALESVVSIGDSLSMCVCVQYSHQPAASQLYKRCSEQVEDGGGFYLTIYVCQKHTDKPFVRLIFCMCTGKQNVC